MVERDAEGRALSRPLRWLLIACGSLSLGLGVLGVFLPVLPTTPFLLLAAGCYLRSSRRLYDWLLATRFPGTYIRDWRSGKGLPRGLKISILVLLFVTIVCSAVFFVSALWLRILLGLVLIGVSIHILRLPTRPPAGTTEGVDYGGVDSSE